MASNFKIDFSKLDYDDIKSDLVNYFSGQPGFSNFNYSNSNIDILISLLSRITTLLSANMNASFNESFIDSAEIRSNVIKISNMLGYIPKRKNSSIIKVNLSNISSTSNGTGVNRLLQFDAISSNGLDFYYVDPFVDYSGLTNIDDISFHEGSIIDIENAYIGDGLDYQKIIIDDIDVGNKLFLYTKESNGTFSQWEEYEPGKFYDDPANTKLFFIWESPDGGYEISFGNGKYGAKPQSGEILSYIYIKPSEPDESNNLSTFSWKGDAQGIFINSDYTGNIILDTDIESLEPSSLGKIKESVEDIKFTSRLYYQSQGRAVTEEDYLGLVLAIPEIKKAFVYGGNKLSPKRLGKVFITVKPDILAHPGDSFTEQELLDFKNHFESINVITIDPIFQNPQNIYLEINSIVRYDKKSVRIPSVDTIKNSINSYINVDNLEFNTYLKMSDFRSYIDSLDSIIKSNLMTITKYTLLDEKNIKNRIEDGLYVFKLVLYPDITKKTKIIQGINEYIEDIDYTITYLESDTRSGLYSSQINFINGDLGLSQSGTPETRIYFDTIDEDIFLDYGQLFYSRIEEIDVTIEAV